MFFSMLHVCMCTEKKEVDIRNIIYDITIVNLQWRLLRRSRLGLEYSDWTISVESVMEVEGIE